MSRASEDTWTFVTNHTRVLICFARNPDIRLRDVADAVGITERAVQRIVADLVEAGYVERKRVGRRNRYKLNRERSLRHTSENGTEIGDLINVLALDQASAETVRGPRLNEGE
jgi:predicted transcriptional regulator